MISHYPVHPQPCNSACSHSSLPGPDTTVRAEPHGLFPFNAFPCGLTCDLSFDLDLVSWTFWLLTSNCLLILIYISSLSQPDGILYSFLIGECVPFFIRLVSIIAFLSCLTFIFIGEMGKQYLPFPILLSYSNDQMKWLVQMELILGTRNSVGQQHNWILDAAFK